MCVMFGRPTRRPLLSSNLEAIDAWISFSGFFLDSEEVLAQGLRAVSGSCEEGLAPGLWGVSGSSPEGHSGGWEANSVMVTDPLLNLSWTRSQSINQRFGRGSVTITAFVL